MQYRKKRFEPRLTHKQRAIDILYANMIFFNDKAVKMTIEIVEALKKSEISRGDKLADMHKAMIRVRELTLECASKLAPYQSPKLESVEVKKTVEHRFVLRAPTPVKNTQSWLNQVDQEAKLLPSPQKIIDRSREELNNSKNILNKDIITDLEPEENYIKNYLEAS